MKKRINESDFKSNRVINKAATELTKTAIIVTVMFMICLGFDLWYYVLAYNGVIAYVLNSPIQVGATEIKTFRIPLFSWKFFECISKQRNIFDIKLR